MPRLFCLSSPLPLSGLESICQPLYFPYLQEILNQPRRKSVSVLRKRPSTCLQPRVSSFSYSARCLFIVSLRPASLSSLPSHPSLPDQVPGSQTLAVLLSCSKILCNSHWLLLEPKLLPSKTFLTFHPKNTLQPYFVFLLHTSRQIEPLPVLYTNGMAQAVPSARPSPLTFLTSLPGLRLNCIAFPNEKLSFLLHPVTSILPSRRTSLIPSSHGCLRLGLSLKLVWHWSKLIHLCVPHNVQHNVCPESTHPKEITNQNWFSVNTSAEKLLN